MRFPSSLPIPAWYNSETFRGGYENEGTAQLLKYIGRRLLQSVPLLIVITFAGFMLLHKAPGGPLSAYTGPGARLSVAELGAIKHQLGLDQPLLVQYFYWLIGIIQGNWGWSFRTQQPVLEMIWERLPATLELIGAGTLLSLAIAIPVGVISAVKKYSWFDYVITFGSYFGYSMPIFWFGFLLMQAFVFHFPIFPSAGTQTPGEPWTLYDNLVHLAMPTITLALAITAGWSRYARSSMLEQLNQDFVRTARAKGLRETTVIVRHALRNALIPVVTVVMIDVPALFGGTIVTEAVWSWPGIGSLLLRSLGKRDYPVAQGILLASAVLIVLGNLIADVLYAWLDPRIRYE